MIDHSLKMHRNMVALTKKQTNPRISSLDEVDEDDEDDEMMIGIKAKQITSNLPTLNNSEMSISLSGIGTPSPRKLVLSANLINKTEESLCKS
jgi:hypothetical protein